MLSPRGLLSISSTDSNKSSGMLGKSKYVMYMKIFTMERFNEIFDNNALNDLSSVLEIFCENINEEMDIICLDHEYVSDHIDIGIDKVKKIWYCNKCHASKKSE